MAQKKTHHSSNVFDDINQGTELRLHFCVFSVVIVFFKLAREKPELLRKRLYFLAVITTLQSWKGTKILLHTEARMKVGSLDNHSFLFIEHRNCL